MGALPLIQHNCAKKIIPKENIKNKNLKSTKIRYETRVKYRGIYSKRRFFRKICWPWSRETAKEEILGELKKNSFQPKQGRWRKERIGL